jgi:hypothetical protein
VVRDEVLLPLGMTRTTTRPDGRAAQGWAVHPWADVLLPEPEHDAVSMAPAGQLWATLADLGRFAAFLLDGADDVLASSVVEEMAVPAGIDPSDPGWSAYGLGLQVMRVDGATLVGHGGSMPGFLAGVLVDRESGVGAVVLTNSTHGPLGPLVRELLQTVREAEPAVGAQWAPATGRRRRRPRPGRHLVLGDLRLRPHPARRRPAEAGRARRCGTRLALPLTRRRQLARAGRLPRRRGAAPRALDRRRRRRPRPRQLRVQPHALRHRGGAPGRRRRRRVAAGPA